MRDGRTSLVKEVFRVAKEARAGLIVLENVGALRHQGLQDVRRFVFNNASAEGFSLRWATVKGVNVGAPLSRERIFLVATRSDAELQRFREAGC